MNKQIEELALKIAKDQQIAINDDEAIGFAAALLTATSAWVNRTGNSLGLATGDSAANGWPMKGAGSCACKYERKEDFGEAVITEQCGYHAQQSAEIATLTAERDALKAENANIGEVSQLHYDKNLSLRQEVAELTRQRDGYKVAVSEFYNAWVVGRSAVQVSATETAKAIKESQQ
jgi:hypothetical protein